MPFPEAEPKRAARLRVTFGILAAFLPEIACYCRRDIQPGDAFLQPEINAIQTTEPQFCGMLEEPQRLPAGIFDHHHVEMVDIVRALPAHFIADVFRRTLARNGIEFFIRFVNAQNKINIRFTGGTKHILFRLARFQRRHMRLETVTPPGKVQCHVIAKLTIEIRNAGDDLHKMTAFLAPLVDFIHLNANQSAFAKFGQGAHQLGSSHAKLNTFICPRLGDQTQR